MNFKAVLALPKTAGSAQTNENISFICIVWSTLYVYLCENLKKKKTVTVFSNYMNQFLKPLYFLKSCSSFVKFCQVLSSLVFFHSFRHFKSSLGTRPEFSILNWLKYVLQNSHEINDVTPVT